MIEGAVGEYEKTDINAQVAQILRDLGNPEPPLKLADVRLLLSLDLQYYSSADPGLIAELTHRFTLFAKKAIPDFARTLMSGLAKSRLCAFWIPDSRRILLDNSVPEPKHRWIQGHEIAHSITPWHREYLLGDNRHMVDPACRAIIEAEANYGAGRLLFLQDRFAADARDLSLSFDSVKQLAKRYGNTIVSTFWRMVEDRDPSCPVFGLISVHPRHSDIGAHDGADPWRYFIRSAAFRTQFGQVSAQDIYTLVALHASTRRRGPVLQAQERLVDVLGSRWEITIESFSNSHELLTLGVVHRPYPPQV